MLMGDGLENACSHFKLPRTLFLLIHIVWIRRVGEGLLRYVVV